jgi:hypothetical protein
VNYRGQSLAEGSAGRVRAGDRLPWVCLADGTDNFAAMKGLAWQGHVYGTPGPKIEAVCAEAGLALSRFAWSAAAARAGIARNAFYLVRPDGYVALATTRDAAEDLAAYQARHGLRFGGAT